MAAGLPRAESPTSVPATACATVLGTSTCAQQPGVRAPAASEAGPAGRGPASCAFSIRARGSRGPTPLKSPPSSHAFPFYLSTRSCCFVSLGFVVVFLMQEPFQFDYQHEEWVTLFLLSFQGENFISFLAASECHGLGCMFQAPDTSIMFELEHYFQCLLSSSGEEAKRYLIYISDVKIEAQRDEMFWDGAWQRR